MAWLPLLLAPLLLPRVPRLAVQQLLACLFAHPLLCLLLLVQHPHMLSPMQMHQLRSTSPG
jgi:hypothetical protein